MKSNELSEEKDFQTAYEELIEAVNATACADPSTEDEIKTTLIEMINEALHITS